MPKENCPQVHAWCPHHNNDCQPVSDVDDPCIHARGLVSISATLSAMMAMYKMSPDDIIGLTERHALPDPMVKGLLR